MLGVFDLNDGEMLLSIGLRIMIPCYLKEIDFEPSCTDEYFAVQEVSTVFIIQGKKVIVENEVLATALLRLPKKRREALLLHFYLCYNDAEIGRMFGRCRSAINYRKHIALRLL